jgi:hypothetical protein
MNAEVRRTLEMADRALTLCREFPDDGDPGYSAGVVRLGDLVGQGEVLKLAQRDGTATARLATEEKRRLRRTILQSHVPHLAGVSELAAREKPDARTWFVVGRGRNTFAAFTTAVRSMLERAEGEKELLVRHGLSPRVLDDLRAKLAELDAAARQGSDGRKTHVGARRALEQVAAEAFDVVKTLDGINRIRFANDPQRLAQWENASTVRATPQRAAQDGQGEEQAA